MYHGAVRNASGSWELSVRVRFVKSHFNRELGKGTGLWDGVVRVSELRVQASDEGPRV